MTSKKGRPSTQEVYRGQTNQGQKLHKSRNSRKEENDWFLKADSQSTKVLKSLESQLTLLGVSNGNVQGSNPPSPNYLIIKKTNHKDYAFLMPKVAG